MTHRRKGDLRNNDEEENGVPDNPDTTHPDISSLLSPISSSSAWVSQLVTENRLLLVDVDTSPRGDLRNNDEEENDNPDTTHPDISSLLSPISSSSAWVSQLVTENRLLLVDVDTSPRAVLSASTVKLSDLPLLPFHSVYRQTNCHSLSTNPTVRFKIQRLDLFFGRRLVGR
ncbi:hypothetical protein L1987_03165 [Smallanthus sonchifolius]|uniref:Uncharacterized protein n=1 Tax=Smallanthus sonchifolius TaxID=185202 RepID=A0ACB9K9R1_9ASTR|nr:hypothetical protein L1987_03165 [Smallanthus sonchifolius]